MNPVEPILHTGAMLVVFAKDQPEYLQLPASVDEHGCVMTEWEPSAEELGRLFTGGRIRLWLHHTGVEKGRRLTPMMLEVTTSESETARES